jgi:hypothetical protein
MVGMYKFQVWTHLTMLIAQIVRVSEICFQAWKCSYWSLNGSMCYGPILIEAAGTVRKWKSLHAYIQITWLSLIRCLTLGTAKENIGAHCAAHTSSLQQHQSPSINFNTSLGWQLITLFQPYDSTQDTEPSTGLQGGCQTPAWREAFDRYVRL